MALAKRLGHLRRPALRLGLANLHRPGTPAPLLVVSLGVGLTTLVAIAQIATIASGPSARLPSAKRAEYPLPRRTTGCTSGTASGVGTGIGVAAFIGCPPHAGSAG